MRILITGGAGYIGMSLIHKLMKSTSVEELVIYDNLARGNYSFFLGQVFSHPAKCRLVQGDLMDSHRLKEVLEGIDVVIHLAAKVSTPFSDKDAHAYDQVNHWGSAQLAIAIEESQVNRVIYLSSASVYGSTEIAVNEFYTPNPKTFYGISKLAGEKQIKRLSSSRDIYILRAANVYGHNPAMRIDAVINKFMFLANYRGRLTIDGDGSQYRSFIHVEKLAQIIAGLIESEAKPGVYNIAEHNLTISALVSQIKALYPELEVLSINHNMPLRTIQVNTDCKIFQHVSLPQKSLNQELQEFQQAFNF